MALNAGTRLGPYTIISQLGAGGMGEVYRASDPRLEREVAIKVLPEHLAEDPSALKRFEREAKAVAALSHPNILDIHDFGTDQGVLYTVTELLEGETLRSRISRGAIPLQPALKIACAIADGLAAAHSKGVVHRDLKPENIFLTSDGRIKILDFGLAQYSPEVPQHNLTSTPTESEFTKKGTVMGTVPYMSPEQVRGQGVDARSDVFSFGAVLYEVIAGTRAFPGESSADIVSAILSADPLKTVADLKMQGELRDIVLRCLKKNPEERFASGQELAPALHKFYEETTRPHVSVRKELQHQLKRPKFLIPAILGIIAIGLLLGWFFRQRARARWAKEVALPQVTKLIQAEKYYDAFMLAREAAPYLKKEPSFQQQSTQYVRFVNLQTTPAGADVYIKDYSSVQSEWFYLGRSPLSKLQIPFGLLRWKIGKAGYETIEEAHRYPQFDIPTQIFSLSFTLDREGTRPPNMLRVAGGSIGLEMPGLDHLSPIKLEDYWIDKYEVTNREFKEFVKAGGYRNPKYWKHQFFNDGKVLSWEQAMSEFRDRTGQPGPSTWEVGDYAKGQDQDPVTGVSWYEAAAYAEFAGKSLPTVYHWNHAAGTWDSAYVIPLSNFGGKGVSRIGANPAMNRYGSYDMAGNVKEWCWNGFENKRFILGGAWNEPTYMFNDPDAQPPFFRHATYGFRCVKYIHPIAKASMDPIPWVTRDYRKEKPVSDEIFNVYRSLYSYDKTPLNALIESEDNSPENWKAQKITFDAAYGNERMIAYLFLPKNSPPPHQTVIFFPGSGVIYLRSSNELLKDARNMNRFGFIAQSGRAVLYPIYKGTFERNDGLNSDYPSPTTAYRDYVIRWYKDLARSIDYLETRKDIDTQKLAFYGASWGGTMGLIIPALEPRLKANILLVGGFYLQKTLPEVDQINFVTRVKIPTLMLNGRYDFFFPIDTSQTLAFQFLGTPEKDKKQVIYPTGHDTPRTEMIREVLAWLDRYLGPVSHR